MSVFRIEKNKNYTTMSNYHFRETEMSLRAKGLLSLMLSLPDEWDYSIKGLVSICKESDDAIRNTLAELERFGYLKRTREQDDKGRFHYVYDIYECPAKEDLPCADKRHADNPCPGKHTQLNTKVLSTKELSTNNKKGDPVSERKFQKPLEEKIREWIQYKTEKRDTYKPRGLDAMLTEIANNVEKYGDFAVINLINTCMANNWKGIIWEILAKNPPRKFEIRYDSNGLPLVPPAKIGDIEHNEFVERVAKMRKEMELRGETAYAGVQ